MRAAGCALLALVSAGCTLDVGDGQLPPFTVDGRMSLPSAAARASTGSAAFDDADGEHLSVQHATMTTIVSVSKELEFFNASESSLFKQQLGDKAGAVSRIDVEVKRCSIVDASTGQPMHDIDVEAVLDGTILGPPGMTARVALSGDTRDRVLQAVAAEQAVVLGFGVDVGCAPDRVNEVPDGVEVHLLLQPVLVIDELKAL